MGNTVEAEIISGNLTAAIKELKLLKGKVIVLLGSISSDQSSMKETLIDEYHIQLCPVLTAIHPIAFADQYRVHHVGQFFARWLSDLGITAGFTRIYSISRIGNCI